VRFIQRSLAIAVLECFACVANSSHEGSANRVATALAGGVPSPLSQDSIVLLKWVARTPERTSQLCSATLLAPDLVLTARHCIQPVQFDFQCQPDGTPTPNAQGSGYYGTLVSPQEVFVWTGADARDQAEGSHVKPPAATGQRIFTTSWPSACADDIALVQLTPALTSIPLLPIRLEAPTRVGDSVVLVGYGSLQPANEPEDAGVGRRQRAGVSITGVGPLLPTDALNDVGPRSFTIAGGVACPGDSGGPALDRNSNAIVGVFSRFIGTDCTSASATATFSLLAPHATLIRETLSALGQSPVLEGTPEPAGLGARCTRNADCTSASCDVATSTCVADTCDAQDCTAASDAAAALAPIATNDSRRRSGCSVSSEGMTSFATPFGVLLLAAFAGLRLRRITRIARD
jgi:MYXO-CTERM domain-containing protein